MESGRNRRVVRTVRAATQYLTRRLTLSEKRQFIFLSHPLDNTGGALVLLRILREFCERHGAAAVRVVAPSATAELSAALSSLGIAVEYIVHPSQLAARMQLRLAPDDFVFINTSAVSSGYVECVLEGLESGQLNQAYWFLHEDLCLLRLVNPELCTEAMTARIGALARAGKLHLFTPSEETRASYVQAFDCPAIGHIDLRVDTEGMEIPQRAAADYDELHFLLPGGTAGGVKGQLLALMAFHEFIATHSRRAPGSYRQFHLHVAAVGNDFISQQVKIVGNWLLGERFHTYPVMPRRAALQVVAKCNVVICCSLTEAFPMSVIEGMLYQHVVLRNDCPGHSRQLEDGVNGFRIDTQNLSVFAARLHDVLSLQTPSSALQRMGVMSQRMAARYADSTYYPQFARIPGWPLPEPANT